MKHMLLDTVLLFLLLSDAAGGQDSCDALQRGDRIEECCNITVEPEERNEAPGLPLDLPRHCAELRRSTRPACRCLQARWLRLVQMAGPALSGTDRLQALHLNVSRGLARDLLLSFSPAQGPMTISSMEEGKAGKIRLPREVFQSLSSQAAHVVVTVLNIKQLGMFEEDNQMGQVLDDTVVGIMVEDLDISGLQDPVHFTFAHQQLPPNVTPLCVFWEPNKGQAGGWSTRGCVTLPGDKETVCSCNHLTFFTLLLNPALNTSMAQTLVAVANTGCGVAVAFSIFTIAFYIFLRCSYQQFRSEETLRTNLGLHMNLVSSLLLLNLAFLLNSGVSSRAMPGLCSALGGLTHYCLLCCFTWTALEGSHLYLLFIKVLGTYIHHYLAKLCLIGWGFPALVVVVAGAMGSYGEYSIRTTDQQTVVHLCWINSEHLLVHYITNCGYFSLVFLFNTAIFGVVAWKNCHLWSTGMVQGHCKAWRVALAAVGLFCLLGATWALAFLSYGSSSVPMLYLSAILNSLQGLFIFIWLVVLYYPKMEETTNSLSHIMRNDRTVAGSQG
ncbi:adhesion G protein-coupled receptor G3 isoform X2 [Cygnus olor]|uniref:adhesion G protein-coupled receptor G3 isoform X2 n=1 Tax=Cygnus olor TaxID=8869 RepID=UPI001ADE291E|nr:adhesion G protein-coupled receptor G3 isoform X2 [Cygnus olor]